MIHDESLHLADRKRLIHMGADTCGLAKVVTDPAEDRPERVVRTHDRDGLVEVAITNRTHVCGNILINRALVDTRRLDAIEEMQLTFSLGAIGTERAFQVTPIGTHKPRVLAKIDPLQRVQSEPDQICRSLVVEAMFPSPRLYCDERRLPVAHRAQRVTQGELPALRSGSAHSR